MECIFINSVIIIGYDEILVEKYFYRNNYIEIFRI